MSESDVVVILAPMNLEYSAVRAQLREPRQEWHPQGTAFEIGTAPGVPWPIALAVTGEGNADMAALAERAASWFRPRALLVVGVAGGLKNDIELGDVVVATWVYGYHGGKDDAEGFRARPRAWRSPHQLEQAARMAAVKGTWAEFLAEQDRPSVHFKPIAAGEVVLNSRDTPLARQLRQHYDDAAAIEMESAGAASAAQLNASLPVLTVRGISDRADGSKHLSDAGGLQPVAASRAAAFAMAILRELATAVPTTTGPVTTGPVTTGPVTTGPVTTGPVTTGPVTTGPVTTGPVTTGAPAREAADPGLAWRPLAEPLPTVWLPELAGGRRAASAPLELHLMPAQRGVPLEARRLAALRDELIALGRAQDMFEPDGGLPGGDLTVISSAAGIAVASATGTGLAVTRSGQRSAWRPLPADTLGAVLDPADAIDRLAALLGVLLRIGTPGPAEGSLAEGGLAVGVSPSILVSEGRVADLPRQAARCRTTLSPVRVPAADVLPMADLTARPGNVAEELSARLFLAFQAQTA